jgi:hypothetical protein
MNTQKTQDTNPASAQSDSTAGLGGTFSCPICGYDKPHGHSEEVQAAYRDDQIRNDGWISTSKRTPTKSGWYLCADVEVKSNGESQLAWFLWVRQGAARGEKVPEVLYWDMQYHSWSLRNLLGNSRVSGAEGRHCVYATPRLWRDVPPVTPNVELSGRPEAAIVNKRNGEK